MKTVKASSILSSLLVFVFVLSACSSLASAPTEVPTDTPAPTATITLTPTNTPRPSPTPRPTKTPDLAATQKYDAFNAEAQKYFDLGYLSSADGRFTEIDDFEYEWAQLYWYQWFPLDETVSDVYFSAHFAWESAYQNADTSGCGVIFGLQEDKDHYAVFLDRSKVLFLINNGSGVRNMGRTRGSGTVKFSNPAEADFKLIVKDNYAYVLVDDVVVGEYTLSQSQPVRGDLALTVLSGTNKDYGTRCEMTDIHVWTPE
jgi:hypothetical protein